MSYYRLRLIEKGVSDLRLLEDMRCVAAQFPESALSAALYRRRGEFSSPTIVRRFGSWNNALAKAGLKIGKRWRIPDEELFTNMELIWRHFGRQPRHVDCSISQSRFSGMPYITRFGTWNNALKAFVAWANAGGSDGQAAANVEGEKSDNSENGDGGADRTNGADGASAAAPPASSQADLNYSRRTPRDPSARLRFLVMKRDGFRCKQCGRSPATDAGVELEIDHFHPWSAGGKTVLENLQTLCARCNAGKSADV